MSETVISVEGLYKKFCRNLRRSMAYGSFDVARNMLGVSYDKGTLRKDEFWALEDISFKVKKGETLGIIGQNGCGKSTLLRLINGIYPPDKGRIAIKGRIGALIAVGAGFHPHMTGRENIILNGTILGMTKGELKKKFDSIVDFAGLEEFLDAPVSTYSSGMYVRLGFSIAVHCEPDILLVDEVLAVGDVGFQTKCFDKIGQLKNSGMTTFFVSHNLHHIYTFCDKVLVLNKGNSIFNGDPADGMSLYKTIIADLHSSGEIERIRNGTEEFRVLELSMQPALVDNTIQIDSGDDVVIKIKYEALKNYNDVEFDILLKLPVQAQKEFCQVSNKSLCKKIDIAKGKGTLTIRIKRINLNNIRAYLFFALWSKQRRDNLVWYRNIPVDVKGNQLESGWSHFDIDYTVR
ncbi:MAG TPA: ABC transporter ATP-binding protein [Spirochaetota bacterium]|nr:ABC transporter ATP-binding protein [Spirochaetota bacterium]